MTEGAPKSRTPSALLSAWPLLLGLAVLAIPTVITLGRQVWSTEAGAHGPIVLATGAWLIWRSIPTLKAEARPGNGWIAALALLFALPLYVFGRAYDFISLEAAGLYGVGLAAFYLHFGQQALIKTWFPLLYLGFMVPPPGWLVDRATLPLKEFVSQVATWILHGAGIPIFRQGVTLIVAQYQLLMEDACSGMNSLTGLTAISLFYIYLLRRASWQYSLFLVFMIVPIAIIANIVRVMILVLLTYYFGDAVAQGFLHETAGLVLFATALLLVFALDNIIGPLWAKREKKA